MVSTCMHIHARSGGEVRIVPARLAYTLQGARVRLVRFSARQEGAYLMREAIMKSRDTQGNQGSSGSVPSRKALSLPPLWQSGVISERTIKEGTLASTAVAIRGHQGAYHQ